MDKVLTTLSKSCPFRRYVENVLNNPREYTKEIYQQVQIQLEMLKKYDFLPEKGEEVVNWIEKFCILTSGENAGKPVRLMLWQKWIIYSIFSFYGNLDIEEFDLDGNVIGKSNKYVRIVNDVLILIGSGNSKTTFISMIIAYVMYKAPLAAPNIYIGSNAYKQSRLCFDSVLNIIEKNNILKKYARLKSSYGEIEVPKTSAKLVAMSSDGKNLEGIIPALLVIDEIHGMETSKYADDLRKSTKRSDKLIIETTTDGTVRNGYLDDRKELAKNYLERNSADKEFRKFFAIYKQDSYEEVIDAYNKNDVTIFRKSNPGIGVAVQVEQLKEKIADMINDPKKKVSVLTKNFNIPQNPITSFFSERECKTKPFNEDLLNGAPVFIGFDMAYTRNPENDLAALEILCVNPITNEEYVKDIYFLPKYWEREIKENNQVSIVKEDMLKAKSKYDKNILYNPRQKKYGYELYANRGDVVVLNEELVEELVKIYGEKARFDCTGITEEFIIYYIAYLEYKYKFVICKVGLDPNKANNIEMVLNSSIQSIDGKQPVVKFKIEDKKNSQPIIQSTKDIRARELVYNNNKLTELHFAAAQAKEDKYGNITFTNPNATRKDGLIANLAARSAYNVFVNNKDTGLNNKRLLEEWWRARMAKDL